MLMVALRNALARRSWRLVAALAAAMLASRHGPFMYVTWHNRYLDGAHDWYQEALRAGVEALLRADAFSPDGRGVSVPELRRCLKTLQVQYYRPSSRQMTALRLALFLRARGRPEDGFFALEMLSDEAVRAVHDWVGARAYYWSGRIRYESWMGALDERVGGESGQGQMEEDEDASASEGTIRRSLSPDQAVHPTWRPDAHMRLSRADRELAPDAEKALRAALKQWPSDLSPALPLLHLALAQGSEEKLRGLLEHLAAWEGDRDALLLRASCHLARSVGGDDEEEDGEAERAACVGALVLAVRTHAGDEEMQGLLSVASDRETRSAGFLEAALWWMDARGARGAWDELQEGVWIACARCLWAMGGRAWAGRLDPGVWTFLADDQKMFDLSLGHDPDQSSSASAVDALRERGWWLEAWLPECAGQAAYDAPRWGWAGNEPVVERRALLAMAFVVVGIHALHEEELLPESLHPVLERVMPCALEEEIWGQLEECWRLWIAVEQGLADERDRLEEMG